LVLIFPPPPVRGLGTVPASNDDQDRADVGLQYPRATAFGMMVNGSQTPGLAQVFSTSPLEFRRFYVDVDRVKAKSMERWR